MSSLIMLVCQTNQSMLTVVESVRRFWKGGLEGVVPQTRKEEVCAKPS